MKTVLAYRIFSLTCVFLLLSHRLHASAEVDSLSFINGKLRLSGLLQIQSFAYPGNVGHGEDSYIDKSAKINIRRGRMGMRVFPMERLSLSAELDISHKYSGNDPLLFTVKDSHATRPVKAGLWAWELKFNINEKSYVRFGRFRIPVWREEMRQDEELILIERSRPARYLRFLGLSGYHDGGELGLGFQNGFRLTVNVSRTPKDNPETYRNYFTKKTGGMNSLSGRMELPMMDNRMIAGLSFVKNTFDYWPKESGSERNATLFAVAPDFFGMIQKNNHRIELETGFAYISGPEEGSEWMPYRRLRNNFMANGTFTWKTFFSGTGFRPDWISLSAGMGYYHSQIGLFQFSDHPDYASVWIPKEGYTYRLGSVLSLTKNFRLHLDYELERGSLVYQQTYLTHIIRSQLSIIL